MNDIIFNKPRNCITFILIITLLLYSNTQAQSIKNDLRELMELKSSPDFNPESSYYIDLLIDISQEFNYKNPDSTAILLKEAYDLSITSKYRKGEVKALHNYGSYFSIKGELEKAYQYNTKAIKVANAYNIKDQKINALNNLGLDFWLQGNNQQALTNYLEGLDLAQEIDDYYMTSVINDNIAILYRENGDYETALAFNEKSRQISLEHNMEESLAETLLNMAITYKEKKDFAKANSIIDNCIKIFEKVNRADWMSNSYQVKGSIALGLKDYNDALKWYTKSKNICDEIDYALGYSTTYIGFAESYLGLENLKSAEVNALKGLQVSKDLSDFESIKEANSILGKIYHNMGQDTKAYAYQNEYMQLFEKRSKEDFRKGLGVLRSEIKFENQKKQLIEENSKAVAQQWRYIYAAIAALIILSLFLILIGRTNRIQKNFTKMLQTKQDALILRESELKDSNETKDKLFSVIAHDLRGPINSFHSLMKLYVENDFTKEETDFLFPKALQDIGRISEMLSNLLLWAKTQMQGSIIKPQLVDINILVKDSILLLNPLAKKKSIKIINSIVKNTNSYSDKNHLDIVLRNLISNAIKFTNQNGEINISAIEKENEIQIEVKDNGIGMDIEIQKTIFEKSNNKSTYGTNNEKGTGLGLTLCRDMVESNGGKIWIESTIEQGTSIYFTVPL